MTVSPASTIRVLLCDDVPELRAVLREVLDEDPAITVVGEVANGEDCTRVVAEEEPDVVLLDLSMPGMDGLEAIPILQRVSPRTAIVVFSGFGVRMGRLALERGAQRFIEKGEPLDLISRTVREVAEGHRAEGGSPPSTGSGMDGGPGGGDRLRNAWAPWLRPRLGRVGGL